LQLHVALLVANVRGLNTECFSILSWNVRGLNSSARRNVFRDMVLAHRPKMVCLQETKMETVSQQIAQETLDQMIDEFQFLPAQGIRGGILLGWNSDLVEATDLSLK
jgi:DNA phosphorothioation-dependent restriction protein DptG